MFLEKLIEARKTRMAAERFFAALGPHSSTVIEEMNGNPLLIAELAGFARIKCDEYRNSRKSSPANLAADLAAKVAIYAAQKKKGAALT